MAEKRTLRPDDDDVVLQKPEDSRVVIPVFHTASACPGAATAYLLRRIAYRAGAYAPGIQEYVFFDLANYSQAGGTLDAVQRWFGARVADLQEMGYRLNARRVAEPTPTILEWVKGGVGYRGAVMPTDFRRLHPQEVEPDINHAVAVSMDRYDGAAEDDLVIVDPWPGEKLRAPDRGKVPPVLEAAHRDFKYNAIIFYWAGWS
ncbi:MAG TPA: hypothetical protein VHE35_21430 [Kofleriaceae bacterium]|nr:hypothetical protein [Kofleriaceae bacterium]